jgi:hypothetical protein
MGSCDLAKDRDIDPLARKPQSVDFFPSSEDQAVAVANPWHICCLAVLPHLLYSIDVFIRVHPTYTHALHGLRVSEARSFTSQDTSDLSPDP